MLNRNCSLLIPIAIWVCCTHSTSYAVDELPVRVMSFNIRYGTAKDGENHWDKRKGFLVETIQEFNPDLLGTQETLAFQRDFIQDQLKQFQSFGVGRDDGKENGEMAALFYNSSRFEKLDGGHFWLSPTPEVVGSKGWDAALPRIATWVKLVDKSCPNPMPILFLNTHFDHMGVEARLQSARLIRNKIASLGVSCRIIITGDFNAGADSEPYQALFGNDDAQSRSITLQDTLVKTSSPPSDPTSGTFSGFKAQNTGGPRIDWIACSPHWQVRQAKIDRTERNGRTPSDHFPVTAVLRTVDANPTLRILSYNIHHGRGMDDRIDLKRIARIIRNADADAVALQEVDRYTKRSGNVDQSSELGRLTGMYSTFAKAIDFEGGEYGQAILSRFPPQGIEVTKLANRDKREQRIAVSALFEMEKGVRIQFISTHLDHAEPTLRLEQAEQLVGLSSRDAVLSILAGDINDSPDSKVLAKITESWRMPNEQQIFPTFPSASPSRQIDHIFVRGTAKITKAQAHVALEPVASDHRPLFLSIQASSWR